MKKIVSRKIQTKIDENKISLTDKLSKIAKQEEVIHKLIPDSRTFSKFLSFINHQVKSSESKADLVREKKLRKLIIPRKQMDQLI